MDEKLTEKEETISKKEINEVIPKKYHKKLPVVENNPLISSDEDKKNLELLSSIIENSNVGYGKTLRARKYRPLIEWINKKTPLLNDPFYKIQTKIYWVIRGMTEFPKCKNDGKDLKNMNVSNPFKGYQVTTCCKKCQYELMMKNSKITCKERYGVEYSWQSENNKSKSRATCRKRYGKDYVSQVPEVIQRAKNTCKERYGKESYSQTEEFLKRSRATCKERYGKESYSQTEEFVKKMNQTCMREHGVMFPSQIEGASDKAKATCRERYGKDSYSQTEEFQQKYKATCQERHGVDNVWCHGAEGREKAKKTKERLYGDPNYNNREQAAKTCKERYGDESIFNVRRDEFTRRFMEANYKKLCENKYVFPLFSLEDYLNKTPETVFKWKCLECRNEFESKLNWNMRNVIEEGSRVLARCPKCHPIFGGTSKQEQQFISEIRRIYHGKIEERVDVLQAGETKREWLQIDCYLPDLKIGFEYDGIYFHKIDTPEEESKNLFKTRLAEQQGIKLIHVRSDDWHENKEKLLEIYSQVIAGDVDFSKIYDLTQKVLYVDRGTFNRCFQIPGYRYTGETEPELIYIICGERTFLYKESGFLVYSKIF